MRISEDDARSMSLVELIGQREILDAEIGVKEREAKSKFVEDLREFALQKGLDLNEFVEIRASGKARNSRRNGEPKYRDPDEPQNTWSGRGRQPNWLIEKLALGADMAEFEVGSAAP